MQDDTETPKQKYNVHAAEVNVWPWLDVVNSHFMGNKSFFRNWQMCILTKSIFCKQYMNLSVFF